MIEEKKKRKIRLGRLIKRLLRKARKRRPPCAVPTRRP